MKIGINKATLAQMPAAIAAIVSDFRDRNHKSSILGFAVKHDSSVGSGEYGSINQLVLTPAKAHLYCSTDARGNEWFTVIDRAGRTVIETRDSDEANKVADQFSEIIGCEDHP
jgi:hypothetical protein